MNVEYGIMYPLAYCSFLSFFFCKFKGSALQHFRELATWFKAILTKSIKFQGYYNEICIFISARCDILPWEALQLIIHNIIRMHGEINANINEQKQSAYASQKFK